MNLPRVFDQKHYESLNTSRAAVVTRLLGELKEKLRLCTAIDVGCGLGYFSGLLDSLGLEVSGMDGRMENAEEAQRRFPKILFHCRSVEDAAILALGKFDLVFCFGLLYHLENPLLAIRHLQAMTERLLLVEGVTYPGDDPSMTLVDEVSSKDQGLRHVAFYPTEACLVKMLYRAGFPYVYRVAIMPKHSEYHDAPGWRRNRTVLAASRAPLEMKLFTPLAEPASRVLPWDPASGVPGPAVLNKIRRFLHGPLKTKLKSFRRPADILP